MCKLMFTSLEIEVIYKLAAFKRADLLYLKTEIGDTVYITWKKQRVILRVKELENAKRVVIFNREGDEKVCENIGELNELLKGL